MSLKSKKLALVRMSSAAFVIYKLIWVKHLMIKIRYAPEN